MKIDGIDGNVTAKGHEKWIELQDIQFGVGRGITSAKPGNQTNREASIPGFSSVTVTKVADETTPKIFTEACIGQSKKIEVHLCKTGADQLDSYLEYTFSDVLIAGYSIAADGSNSHPHERIELNFSKIEMKYIPFDDAHKAGSPVPAGYDLVEGKKV